LGQETGGAYNGTVAGFMPEIKLPNSKLKVRIGHERRTSLQNKHLDAVFIQIMKSHQHFKIKLKVKILNYNGFFKTLKHCLSTIS
jgi:hypothetical protein